MSDRSFVRRIAYVVWAMALAAGLSFSGAQAQSLHTACTDTCENACNGAGCKRSRLIGCTCYYTCDDGNVGAVVCAI